MTTRGRIGRASELKEGATFKFSFKRGKKIISGFVARHGGGIVAYQNVCRHLPLPLDDGTGKFFTKDGNHFLCQNHGALFDPLTGLCTRGPCEGARLKPLAVEVVADEIRLCD